MEAGAREGVLVLGAAHGEPVTALAAMGNRHGLIAGATGTGKTVSLQVLAEGWSRLGVPVFAADVKGDLSGLAAAGAPSARLAERLARIPLPGFGHEPSPVLPWDVYGEQGLPLRSTISEMGPLLLANLLQLNDTQEGLLYAAFRIADEQGLLLLDLKDLQALLRWMADNARTLRASYGNIAPASVGAVQRRLMVLESQGGDRFFGEPALRLDDLMRVDPAGRGVIGLLDASRLLREAPRVYSALLLWLLAELFEQLPERGDADRPRFVLVFDEAHLLFDGAGRALLEQIERTVRLVRSKGVGVYFVTQSPLDLPDAVGAQLGLKIQHALRAYTPRERKALRAVAEGFRAAPGLDTERVITELGTGEALVSALDAEGRPSPVVRTLMAPPRSRIGPLTGAERADLIAHAPLAERYRTAVDRESAYELLARRAAEAAQPGAGAGAGAAPDRDRAAARQGLGAAVLRSAARSAASQLGRQLMRGLLGALFGRGRR